MTDDEARLRELILKLAQLVTEFEELAPGRKFTPDGHMIGSLGELIAKNDYGLELSTASTKGYDALSHASNGTTRTVEIKATQGQSVALRHASPLCDDLLVLKLDLRNATWCKVYYGPAPPVWESLSPRMPANGQRTVSLRRLGTLLPQ